MLVMSCSIYCNLLRWLMASSALPPAASRPISAQNAAAAGRCSPDHFLHVCISSRLLVRSLATTHQLRANKHLLGSFRVTELLGPVTAGAKPRQATSPSQPWPEPKPRPSLEPSGPGGLLSCCSASLLFSKMHLWTNPGRADVQIQGTVHKVPFYFKANCPPVLNADTSPLPLGLVTGFSSSKQSCRLGGHL